MNDESLAGELAGLRYEDGYVFENGTPYREKLSKGAAYGLITALRARGYAIVSDTGNSPSIAPELKSFTRVSADLR
jgi:hypothetical protein